MYLDTDTIYNFQMYLDTNTILTCIYRYIYWILYRNNLYIYIDIRDKFTILHIYTIYFYGTYILIELKF